MGNKEKTPEGWIHEIDQWETNDSVDILQEGTIIPDDLSSEMPRYMKQLSLQINANYEQNLFDCTAVMMRRLFEILLILSYKHHDIEIEIMDQSGTHHVVLNKITCSNCKILLLLSLSIDRNTFMCYYPVDT